MLTIIHGNDIVASRKYFLEQKASYPDSLLIDTDSVTLTDLTQIFEGGGLFGESKHIFIEQIITKRKKSGDYKDIITYLDTHAAEHTIVLWENKELEIGILKMFKNASPRVFKLPQTLFSLLDNIKPGNGKLLVSQFHQTIEATEVEMVFFMLIRQIRMLLAIHPNQNMPRHSDLSRMTLGDIEEIKKLTWQRGKMQQQAAQFDGEQLLIIYKKLFEIERGQKTGTLSAPLTTTIDFLLLEI
jgi:hypothetical protein